MLRDFAMEPDINEAEFLKIDTQSLTDRLYHHLVEHYRRKNQWLQEQTLPVLQNVLAQNGDRVENIAIPFTDGIRGVQIVTNLRKTIESGGKEMIDALERQITLGLIDDAWKNHLRKMDELKQSVQLASLEQKDPLLIYKFEAFNLFRTMIGEANKHIVSFLMRCGIPMQQEQDIQQAEVIEKTDMSKMRSNREEIEEAGQEYGANEHDRYTSTSTADVKRDPVRNLEPKIGRNDPCPCGSGKKFKQCHGK